MEYLKSLKKQFLIFTAIFIIISCNFILSCKSKNSNPNPEKAVELTVSSNLKFDENQIRKFRKEKDDEFKGETSPLPDKIKNKFVGLNYFEPSKKYIVHAKLFPSEKNDTVIILTTKKDDLRKMINLGKFKFALNGEECELTGYISPNVPESIFIPFGDATNGKQTYEGGRYLDIELNKENNDYILDFNYAYNPYCTYNKKYSCPLVPNENILKVPVKAGEKMFRKKKLLNDESSTRKSKKSR